MLTRSQVKVLSLWANGHNYDEIAKKEGLSCDSVKNHMRNAMKRAEVGTSKECVTLALALGLLEINHCGVIKPAAKEF